jgi:hypothetical protein
MAAAAVTNSEPATILATTSGILAADTFSSFVRCCVVTAGGLVDHDVCCVAPAAATGTQKNSWGDAVFGLTKQA